MKFVSLWTLLFVMICCFAIAIATEDHNPVKSIVTSWSAPKTGTTGLMTTTKLAATITSDSDIHPSSIYFAAQLPVKYSHDLEVTVHWSVGPDFALNTRRANIKIPALNTTAHFAAFGEELWPQAPGTAIHCQFEWRIDSKTPRLPIILSIHSADDQSVQHKVSFYPYLGTSHLTGRSAPVIQFYRSAVDASLLQSRILWAREDGLRDNLQNAVYYCIEGGCEPDLRQHLHYINSNLKDRTHINVQTFYGEPIFRVVAHEVEWKTIFQKDSDQDYLIQLDTLPVISNNGAAKAAVATDAINSLSKQAGAFKMEPTSDGLLVITHQFPQSPIKDLSKTTVKFLKTKILDQSDMKGCLVTFVNSTKVKHYFPTNTGKYLPIEVFPEEGRINQIQCTFTVSPWITSDEEFWEVYGQGDDELNQFAMEVVFMTHEPKENVGQPPYPHIVYKRVIYGNTMSLYDFWRIAKPSLLLPPSESWLDAVIVKKAGLSNPSRQVVTAFLSFFAGLIVTALVTSFTPLPEIAPVPQVQMQQQQAEVSRAEVASEALNVLFALYQNNCSGYAETTRGEV